MPLQSGFIESWSSLAGRLSVRSAISGWAVEEPTLAGGASIDDLLRMTAAGADPDAADSVLGALVRTAAEDCGGDPDAALVVVHLLADGVRRLAGGIADLCDGDAMPLVVGELMAQVLGFPWRRRTRAFASNLLRDTRTRLMEELLGVGRHYRGRVWLAPMAPDVLTRQLDRASSVEADSAAALRDLLDWAIDTGVVDRSEAQLLVTLVRAKAAGAGRCQVALEHGVNERTVRRRRDRAVAALRDAAARYLAEVA